MMKNLSFLLVMLLLLGGCRSYYAGKLEPQKKLEARINPLLPYVNLKSLPNSYWIYKKSPPRIEQERVLGLGKNIPNGFAYNLSTTATMYSQDIVRNVCQLTSAEIEFLDVNSTGVAELRILKYKKPRNPLISLIGTAGCIAYPSTWVGFPAGHRKAAIELAVDIKAPDGSIIKTYTAKASHTAMIAAYWGFKTADAPDRAHDKAFIKALNKIKAQMEEDADFLNQRLPNTRLTPEEMKVYEHIKAGDEAYKKDDYATAVEQYKVARSKITSYKKEHAHFLYKMGYSYIKTNSDDAAKHAEEALLKSLELDPKVDFMAPASLYICYDSEGDYEKADKWIRYALDNFTLDDKRRKLLEEWRDSNTGKLQQIQEGRKLLSTPVDVTIENLAIVNDAKDDYFPSLAADESVLYLTSRRAGSTGGLRAGEYDEDLWYSVKDANGQWAAPQNMGKPVNTENNNGIASITGDGQYVICGRCNENDGYGSCDIYGAYLQGNTWSQPQNLGSIINAKEWDAQGSISADGKTLVFASNRAGGYGSEDIWIAHKDAQGKWGAPQNLGPAINGAGSDMSPFMHPDGKTLYFSSNDRSPRIGNFDIYKTVLQDDGSWSAPENLGYPINTEADDKHFVLSPSGLYGLFASDRAGGRGQDDIYTIRFPESAKTSLITFIGYVFDEETKSPIEADVSIVDLETASSVGNYRSNNLSGKFVVVLRPGGNYALSVDKKQYLFHSENFDIPADNEFKTVEKEIFLSKVKVGSKIILKNIFFDTGKSTLRPESGNEIDKLYAIMVDNPSISVEISGHTDNVGSDALNTQLSRNRAEVVASALVAKGISASRIKSVGYGKDRPVADNATEEGRQLNRRTEFQIVGE